MLFSLDSMNPHIIAHAAVAAGAVVFVIAPFFGRTRLAPLSVRLAMTFSGVAALSWSVIGLYLLRHATDQHLSHTALPWPQFWALDHIRATFGGAALGILVCLLANPEFYRFCASGRRSV